MGGTELTRKADSGLTLIEVMLASFILTVSLLAVAATMGVGIASTFIAQEQLIAKQKAREALESVFTARSTQNIVFSDIQSESDGGIFQDGWQSIKDMGTDGIANTDDDGDIETISFPGPDGDLGTSDDIERELTNYSRRVTFSEVLLQSGDVDEEIRKISVDVRFLVRGQWWTVTVSSYISRFA